MNSWTKLFVPLTLTRAVHKNFLLLCDFFTTQVLTGHGKFAAFLFRILIVSSATCRDCRLEDDTPEHALFKCAESGCIFRNLVRLGIWAKEDLSKIVSGSEHEISEFKGLCRRLMLGKANID